MYIHEAAELSETTKKAIEYYCQKGLLSPQTSFSLSSRATLCFRVRNTLSENVCLAINNILQKNKLSTPQQSKVRIKCEH